MTETTDVKNEVSHVASRRRDSSEINPAPPAGASTAASINNKANTADPTRDELGNAIKQNAGASSSNGDRGRESPFRLDRPTRLGSSNQSNTRHTTSSPGSGYEYNLRTLRRGVRKRKTEEGKNITITKKEWERLRIDHDNKFDNFFKNVGAVSTLGASVTFVLIAVDLKNPSDISKVHYFDVSTIRIFLSISWLLFMIALGFSFFFAGIIKDREDETMWGRLDAVASGSLYVLVLSAVLFLSLVVAAYVEWVGFFAAALSGILALLIVIPLLCGRDWAFVAASLVGSGA